MPSVAERFFAQPFIRALSLKRPLDTQTESEDPNPRPAKAPRRPLTRTASYLIVPGIPEDDADQNEPQPSPRPLRRMKTPLSLSPAPSPPRARPARPLRRAESVMSHVPPESPTPPRTESGIIVRLPDARQKLKDANALPAPEGGFTASAPIIAARIPRTFARRCPLPRTTSRLASDFPKVLDPLRPVPMGKPVLNVRQSALIRSLVSSPATQAIADRVVVGPKLREQIDSRTMELAKLASKPLVKKKKSKVEKKVTKRKDIFGDIEMMMTRLMMENKKEGEEVDVEMGDDTVEV